MNEYQPNLNTGPAALREASEYINAGIKKVSKVKFCGVVVVPGIYRMFKENSERPGFSDIVHTCIEKLAEGYAPQELIDNVLEENYYDGYPHHQCEVTHSSNTCTACNDMRLWEEYMYNVIVTIIMNVTFSTDFIDRMVILRQTNRPYHISVMMHVCDQFIVEVTHDPF